MKNKTGFTLAETLITLVIIGVVAALTISTLINNTQDREFKSAWKKAYASVSSAFIRYYTDYGAYTGATSVDNFANAFLPYFQVSARYLTTDNDMTHGWIPTYYTKNHTADYTYKSGDSVYYSRAVLADGTYLLFGSFAPNNCNYNSWPISAPKSCGFACVDVNGGKKPNTAGRDVYCSWVTNTKIIPYGANIDNAYKNTCDTTGYGCASEYLTSG